MHLKGKIFLLSMVLLLLFVVGCNQEKTFNLFERIAENEVSKIEVKDGETGEVIEITNREEINEFLNLFDEITIQKAKDNKVKGYAYSLKINNNRYTLHSNTLYINENFYKAESEIPLQKIESFLNALL